MATSGSGQLTNEQIAQLADEISRDKMETIALHYMGFRQGNIYNIKSASNDPEDCTRKIIGRWANQQKHPEDQVQVTHDFFLAIIWTPSISFNIHNI